MPKENENTDYANLLNPIDDFIFLKMTEHKKFCEEILRVIILTTNITKRRKKSLI